MSLPLHSRAENRTAAFQHVQIIDGTWRSICLHCYLTAGRADTEDKLQDGERGHVCTDLWGRKRTPSSI